MIRKKVKLAFIINDSARKATFKKRKKGLMKKVSELSTLCGIDACAIIYSPYDAQPEVWPNGLGVQRVLSQFKRMSEMEQSKKMVNQESFIQQRISKGNEQLKKQLKDNREKEVAELMFQCLTGRALQTMAMSDLHDLGWLLDQNLKDIYKRIESMRKGRASPSSSSFAAATTATTKQKPIVDPIVAMEAMQRPHWFTDWMNNPNKHLGFGGAGEEMMMLPFGDSHSVVWPAGPFFP
ncbi:LOW QUALITY PROTEIN: agamous-like MADS-box protein AGL80 [Diospyros lotus]|uniref:LOW QUALITY PROTEIN: agamous-like MADS-box protein AGL80 n=1 Tax=Diospyros lotus TaxID=55363 RepID=UPI002255EEBA|nr:LOW QUALITY PROTEIN: agamous-like MADS-box protein AGL80 [Diospyros lotus]